MRKTSPPSLVVLRNRKSTDISLKKKPIDR